MAEASQLLAELHSHVTGEAHEDALATCERVLALSPSDADVLHVKLACLIELGSYSSAVRLIETHNLQLLHTYEHAYCLYQIGCETACIELLAARGEALSGREALLAAQVHYRLGNYAEACTFFKVAAGQGPPSIELSTNLMAALLSAGQAGEARELALSLASSTHFEAFYNHACACIELGQLHGARALLQTALTSCRESLPLEHYTEEEIEVRDTPECARRPPRAAPPVGR